MRGWALGDVPQADAVSLRFLEGLPQAPEDIRVVLGRGEVAGVDSQGVERIGQHGFPCVLRHPAPAGRRRQFSTDPLRGRWTRPSREGSPRAHFRSSHLPKDLGTERHIVLEGQAHHIISATLYTLAAHERHWDPTAIPAMPPRPQGPKDPVTPFHIDQLLSRRATPHLNPSRIELPIASWDTLDTPPKHPAIHILKADA